MELLHLLGEPQLCISHKLTELCFLFTVKPVKVNLKVACQLQCACLMSCNIENWMEKWS